jgi:hypothetical protein
MRIQTLKDLKIALKNTPNKVLENFGAGFSEEPYVELMVWGDEEDFGKLWEKGKKQCPAIDDINKWIKNISKVSQEIEKSGDYDEVGMEEPISSEDFKVEDKKSSPILNKLNGVGE